MGKFTDGLILGVGVALLIVPMRGENMRRLVSERLTTLFASLSESGQRSQYLQLVSERSSQTAHRLKNNA